MLKILSLVYLYISFGLFALNVAGMIIPLRPPNLREMASNPRDLPVDIPRNLDRLSGESETSYVYRLNQLVHQGMVHHVHTRVPIWENYLLWLLYPDYQFYSPERALDRGYGLCSQQAFVVGTLLSRSGFQAKTVGLEGHVVLTVFADNEWLVVDPDYGVVVPFGLEAAEKSPQLIRFYYRHTPDVEKIVDFYTSPENNFLSNTHVPDLENHRYLMAWIIPLNLLLIAVSTSSYRSDKPC
jgi:hypothetical protein